MRLFFFSCAFFSVLSTAVLAQNNLKYETIFFEETTIETTQARFFISGAISEKDVLKAKVKVTNLTDKAIVVKPEECSYTTPKGDLFSKDRWIIVAPRDQESKVIDIKGEDIKTDNTTLKINGFYICNSTQNINGADMPLPAMEEFSVGDFKLKLKGFDQDGKEMAFEYNVRYMGEKIGLMTPGKVVVKSGTGAEVKNQKEKDKVYAFKKKEDFVVKFLFISDSKKDNTLQWKDAFSEATPEKLVDFSIPLKIDLIKTKDKN
jgi:hypothetical protein